MKKFIQILSDLFVGKRCQTSLCNDIYVPGALYGTLVVSEIFSCESFYPITRDCIPHFFGYGNSDSIVLACSLKDSGDKIGRVNLFSLFGKR